MSNESPERITDRLVRQVGELRAAIEGKPELGWQGLGARMAMLEADVRKLKEVQDKFKSDAQHEREQKRKDEGRRNLIIVAALAALGTIVSGLVLFILTGSLGSGP